MPLTAAQWKDRQHRLNLFTGKYLKGVGPIPEDGTYGPLTQKRIAHCKYWLGWEKRSGQWSEQFHKALLAPRNAKVSSRGTVTRGIRRRRYHDLLWAKSHLRTGLATYDGVRVAAVAVPLLEWCRSHGWHGRLVSGYRDPAYSESLCYAICGAPRCPGRCAGRSSNHAGKTATQFAVDVSDYATFGRVIAQCPLPPRIHNSLGAQDPVHFSPSGN